MTSIGVRYLLTSNTLQRWISKGSISSAKCICSTPCRASINPLISSRGSINHFHAYPAASNELNQRTSDKSKDDSQSAGMLNIQKKKNSKYSSEGLYTQLSATIAEQTSKAQSNAERKRKSRRRRKLTSKKASRFKKGNDDKSLKQSKQENEEGFESIWKKIVQSVSEKTEADLKNKEKQKKKDRTKSPSNQEGKESNQLASDVEQAHQVLQHLESLKSNSVSSTKTTNENQKNLKKSKYLWSDNNLNTQSDNSQSTPTSFSSRFSRNSNYQSVEKPARSTTFLTGEEAENARVARPSADLLEDTAKEKDFFSAYLPSNLIPSSDSPKYDAWQKEKKWKVSVGGILSPNEVEIEKVEPLRQMEVPKLSHGLDRVLFNSGVHWLRDERSGIYNFNPEIRNLYDVDLFDYSALPPYLTSSIDEELAQLTKKYSKRYSGSTSSLTALLSHIYFCISSWKLPPLTGFTEGFQGLPKGFSFGAKLPASIILRRFEDANGTQEKYVRYAVDNDKSSEGKQENNNYVLTQLGKSVEKLLTSDTEEYKNYLRINSHKLSEEEKTKKEAYYYSMSDKFMMRSQLDCSDDRLPRKTFDLKTRAVIAVRQDRANWVESSGYMIRNNTGVQESFERELWDMSRGALLKYFFQARIGNMDGIMVAYHSTSTMFGFQYLSREELAERIFSSEEMGEQAFRLSIGLLEKILDSATSFYPNDSLRITMDATGSDPKDDEESFLQVFVSPENNQSNIELEQKPTTEEVRSSLLLEVHVDRYLANSLVHGPIDFAEPKGYKIDVKIDDEIERRKRLELPPLEWKVEYSIVPRSDLRIGETEARLDKVRQRQASVAPLLMPNVEALNERELDRQKELAKNPQALEKFLEDRRTGKAAGMPPAPGQIILGVTDDMNSHVEEAVKMMEEEEEGEESEVEEQSLTPSAVHLVSVDNGDALTARADIPERPAIQQNEQQTWIKESRAVKRLRRLARLGKVDKDEREKTDKLEMYERRG